MFVPSLIKDPLAAIVATRRRACTAVFAVIVGLLSTSLYLQHVVGLEPCPLCIVQRYAFALVAIFSLASSITSNLIGRVANGFAALLSAGGGGVAAWHVWLQYSPPKEVGCGPGLAYMLEELPLTRALPRIFQGSGDCSEIRWSFLGLSIAGWSLVWFTVLLVVLLLALRRRV